MPMTTPIKSAKNVTVSVTPRPSTRSFQRSSLIKFRIKSAFSFANHSAKTGDLPCKRFLGEHTKTQGRSKRFGPFPRVFISFELPPFRFGSARFGRRNAANCRKFCSFPNPHRSAFRRQTQDRQERMSARSWQTQDRQEWMPRRFSSDRGAWPHPSAALRQGRATMSPAKRTRQTSQLHLADVSVKLADTGSTRADAEAFFVGSRRVAAPERGATARPRNDEPGEQTTGRRRRRILRMSALIIQP